MLTKRIIPCLDVTEGRVVKGTSFVNLRDAGDPVELAAFYDRQGADELVFLDITASSDARKTMVEVVERTAAQVFIPLTVGGGIRSIEDMRNLLQAGADKVSINTSAVQDPALISRGAEKFGSQCIVVAIDAKRGGPRGIPSALSPHPRVRGGSTLHWEVYTHGGRRPAGLDAVEWAREAVRLGAGEILLTSMDADGHQTGYDLELTRAIAQAVGVPVIASGGAGEPSHLLAAVVEGSADAVLAASIFHYGTHTIAAVKEYLAAHGVPVRLAAHEAPVRK